MKKILKNTLFFIILTNLGLTPSLEASWRTTLKSIAFGTVAIGSLLAFTQNKSDEGCFIPEVPKPSIPELPSQNTSLLPSSLKQTALIGALCIGIGCLAYWLYNNKLKKEEEEFLDMEDFSDDESQQIKTIDSENEEEFLDMEDTSEDESNLEEESLEMENFPENNLNLKKFKQPKKSNVQENNGSINLSQKNNYNCPETTLHSWLKEGKKLSEIKSLFLVYAKEDKRLINATDNQGNTALHLLVIRQQNKFEPDYIETLRCFLQNGADQTIKNSNRQTAMDLAVKNNDFQSFNFLSTYKRIYKQAK